MVMSIIPSAVSVTTVRETIGAVPHYNVFAFDLDAMPTHAMTVKRIPKKPNFDGDGSCGTGPFLISWPEGKGRAHIFHSAPTEAILSGQLLPVSGYGFADLLRRLLSLLGR